MYAGSHTKLMSFTAAGGAVATAFGGSAVLVGLGLALAFVVGGAWLLMRGSRRAHAADDTRRAHAAMSTSRG